MKYNLEQLKPYRRISWPLDSLFEEFFAPASGRSLSEIGSNFAPVCDVHEDNDNYYIQSDLPGVKKEDVKVELKDGFLVISGERKAESSKEEKNYHLKETSYGSFSRSFRVDDGIDVEKIEGRFEDGVLKLTVPKAKAKKALQVKIS